MSGLVIGAIIITILIAVHSFGVTGFLSLIISAFFLVIGVIVARFVTVKLWKAMSEGKIPQGPIGKVYDFQQRTEKKRGARKDVDLIVWTFRLEHYSKDGTRQPPIPVQMRGEAFTGSINNMNDVQLYDKWREGQLVQTNRVRNVTNNVDVRATNAPITMGNMFNIILGVMIWLVILGIIVVLIAGSNGYIN